MEYRGSLISVVMFGLVSTIAACGSTPSFTSAQTGGLATSTAQGAGAQGADATAANPSGAAEAQAAAAAGTGSAGDGATGAGSGGAGNPLSGAAVAAGVGAIAAAGAATGGTGAGAASGSGTITISGGGSVAGAGAGSGSSGGSGTTGGTSGSGSSGGGTTVAGSGSSGSGSTGSGSTGSGSTGSGSTGSGSTGSGSTGGGTTITTGGGTVVIPPNCDENGATQAQLLTTSLVNDSTNMVVQYRVFQTDCEGNTIALTADQIWFDINARVPSFAPIKYTLTSGSLLQNGTMQDIVGADLFGDTGSNYAHWELNQAIDVAETNGAYVTLTVYLPQYEYVPLVGPSNQLPTYLKFGAAATVETVIALQN